ncbi:MAG: hypothetical protein Q9186_002825 [Xanthomendoza sp. 1 TL-2023]
MSSAPHPPAAPASMPPNTIPTTSTHLPPAPTPPSTTAWPEERKEALAVAAHNAFLANPVTNAEAQNMSPQDILAFINRNPNPERMCRAMDPEGPFMEHSSKVLNWITKQQKFIFRSAHSTYDFNYGEVQEHHRFQSHLAAFQRLFSLLYARDVRAPPVGFNAADGESVMMMGIWQREMAALLLKAETWVEEMKELEAKIPEKSDS